MSPHRGSATIFILGPIAATLLGQAGGFLATKRDCTLMIRWRQRRRRPWQFSIRTAMVVTAWTAVALGLLSWLGLRERHFAVIAFWLPWQMALLWGWGRIAQWRVAK